MVRLAVLGVGHTHLGPYLRVVEQHGRASVSAVWNANPDYARRIAGVTDAAVVATPDAVWNDDTIDGVIICAPSLEHPALLIAAAQSGKALFVEKPVGLTEHVIAEPLADIESANLVFQTGFFLRYHPAIRWLTATVKSGELGPISSVQMNLAHDGLRLGWFHDEFAWFLDPAQAGPGAFFDLGIHLVDLAIGMVGPPSATLLTTSPGSSGIMGYDAHGTGMLRTDSGTLVQLFASVISPGTPPSIAIHGERGSLSLDDRALRISVDGLRIPDQCNVPLTLDCRQGFIPWLDALIGTDHPPLVTPPEAIRVQRVMDALTASAHCSAWVDVEGTHRRQPESVAQ